MAQRQFTMQQLEALVAAEGQGSFRAQEYSETRIIPYHPPPQKRNIQRAIYNVVWESGRALSRRQIAEALGLNKMTWLNAHIEDLARKGYLVKSWKSHRGNRMMYVFEVAR